jgi:hypothetical protein
MPNVPSRTRELNDTFRTTLAPNLGRVLCTAGVSAMGPEFIERCLHQVQSFAAFDADNDPWGEHDFGSFMIDEHRLFFKIDYYADSSLESGAEDPADPATVRVMMIMLAEEY